MTNVHLITYSRIYLIDLTLIAVRGKDQIGSGYRKRYTGSYMILISVFLALAIYFNVKTLESGGDN